MKTAESGNQRSYDAGKTVIGRGRSIAVDTLGLLIVAVSADFKDCEGAHIVIHRIKEHDRRLKVGFVDGVHAKCGLPDWAQSICRPLLQIVLRPFNAIAIAVLPKWWSVERTLAWTNRHGKLYKDVERLTDISETVTDVAIIEQMG